MAIADTQACHDRKPPARDGAQVIQLPGAVPQGSSTRRHHGSRWPGAALIGCGVAMLPWLLVLANSLPATVRVPHWSTAWVGLDALEALGLATTGILLLRRDPRRCLPAAATAVLLIVDAWFDVTTSAPGPGLAMAVVMALCAEVPMAALCVVLALRALPPPTRRG